MPARPGGPKVSRGLAARAEAIGEYARFAARWRKLVARTVAYCSTSVALRPFTGERVPQRLMRLYFDGALRQLGITIVADGADMLRSLPPSILCVNHNSLIDIPCVGVLLDCDYKWVSKREIFRIPFIGWHLRACGHIWVDRERKDNFERLQREFSRVLAQGGSILMFPEGTRSKDGALLKFRSGAFSTAVREKVPVVPIVLDGTERVLVKGSLDLRPDAQKIVQVKVCPPIEAPTSDEGSFDERVILLRDRTRAAMVAALDELRGAPGAAERPTVVSTRS
jgi:1-acyl-sn-glycerol-3-phosphate acyltransferase